MSMSMASILVHSQALPELARNVIHAAHRGPAALRTPLLESAARILHDEVGLDCVDARELLDLPAGSCEASGQAATASLLGH
jgi:hypothetical protein